MNDMSKNFFRLPFSIPKYKTYPLNTAINGILKAYSDDEIWLYNNYISIWVYSWRKRKEYMADFKYDMDSNYFEVCPMLKMNVIEVEKTDNIVKIIMENIIVNRYVFLSVDTFFLDSWWKYAERKEHSQHEMLVIGYDSEKKIVFVADFFKQKYSVQEISYTNFRKAFDANMGYIRERDGIEKIPIITYKYSKENSYIINIKRIKDMIIDFSNSCENTIKDNSDLFTCKEDVLYGIECLDRIIEYFVECIYEDDILDYRIINLVYIFNDIMYRRIDYLILNGYLLEDKNIKKIRNNFKKLSKESRILCSLIIRNNLKKDMDYGKTLVGKVRKTFENLEVNLKDFCAYLEKNI